MKKLRVIDAVDKDIPLLTSRVSARKIKSALRKEDFYQGGDLLLDFSGSEGVAPSFLDETLLIAEEHTRDCGHAGATVVFVQPPTVLAPKHHAIARAHGRALVVNEAGDWEFRKI